MIHRGGCCGSPVVAALFLLFFSFAGSSSRWIHQRPRAHVPLLDSVYEYISPSLMPGFLLANKTVDRVGWLLSQPFSGFY